MAIKTKVPMVYDQAKLQRMQEPFTVRVEKFKGNIPTGIPLPAKDSQPPGAGWTADEILTLEEWLVNSWAGGGYYRISVTDVNGEAMKWDISYDTAVYPEQTPPSLRAAAAPKPPSAPPQQPTAASQAAPAQMPMAPAYPGQWPPPASMFPTTPVQAPAQAQAQAQAPAQGQAPALQPPWTGPGASQSPWAGPGWQPYQPPQPAFVGYDPRTGQPIWGPPAAHFAPPPPQRTIMRDFGVRAPRQDRDRDSTRDRDQDRDRNREREEERKRYEEQLRARDEQLRQMELRQKEAQHQAALERQNQQHEAQMLALKEEIRRLGEGSKNKEADEVRLAREAQTRLEREREREQINTQFRAVQETITKLAEKPGEDPKLRQMELQLYQTQREAETHAREAQEQIRRAEEQRQRDLERVQWDRTQETLQQQLAGQEHRTKEMLREATANRPDPMVEYMKESARLSQEQSRMQADNMREIARMQQTSADRMSAMMMTPQAIASMLRDSSSGADMMLKNVVGSMSGVFDVFRGAVEQITQLTGGAPEPPAARIIEQAVGRAGELADRYLGVKREEVLGEARVKAAQVQAQAQADAHVKATAIQAQMQAQENTRIRQETASRSQQPTAQPAVQSTRKANGTVSGTNGTNGAVNATTRRVAKPEPESTVKSREPFDDGAEDPETGQTIAKVVPINQKRLGKTDEEWFGVALESVTRLRAGVTHFLENISLGEEAEIGEDGEPVGLNPDKAIDALLKGVNYVSAHNLYVRAFEELFKQGMFADLIDVCLPEATQPFRDHCVKILTDEVEVDVSNQAPPDVIDIDSNPSPA